MSQFVFDLLFMSKHIFEFLKYKKGKNLL